MIEKQFQDLTLSALGMGTMRLPVLDGNDAMIDEEKTAEMVDLAMEQGINYYDTAWGYHDGKSGVAMILSGMSNFEQMQQNIRTFETDRPLSEDERKELLAVANGLLQDTLPCTACHYCVSHCPKGLDIPSLLRLYNEHCFTGGGFFAPMALMAVPEEKHPTACVGCRSCEAVCPQQIKVSEAMADFSEKLKA